MDQVPANTKNQDCRVGWRQRTQQSDPCAVWSSLMHTLTGQALLPAVTTANQLRTIVHTLVFVQEIRHQVTWLRPAFAGCHVNDQQRVRVKKIRFLLEGAWCCDELVVMFF